MIEFLFLQIATQNVEIDKAMSEISQIIIPVVRCEHTFRLREMRMWSKEQKFRREAKNVGEMDDDKKLAFEQSAKEFLEATDALKLEKEKTCGKTIAEEKVESTLLKLNPNAHIGDLKMTSFNLFLQIGAAHRLITNYKTGNSGPKVIAPASPTNPPSSTGQKNAPDK